MATLTSRISTTTLSSFATDLEIPTYLHSNGRFPGKRRLASSPWLSYSFPPCHGTESTDPTCFLSPKQQCQSTEENALTPTSGLASCFLHPPLDSCWKWHCSLYAGFAIPSSHHHITLRRQMQASTASVSEK